MSVIAPSFYKKKYYWCTFSDIDHFFHKNSVVDEFLFNAMAVIDIASYKKTLLSINFSIENVVIE